MTGKWLVIAAAVLLAPGSAVAQEAVGAGRVEIGSAIFGGGMLFMPSSNVSEPVSRSYMLSAALTMNLNRWIGLEGDVGVALGRREAHSLFGTAPSDQRTPNMLIYSGNVVYNPFASDRRIVPYVSGGVGAITAFRDAGPSYFALAGNTTYLTVSGGGGLRWFPIRHWGFRGDYRFVGIKNDATARVPGERIVRSAHRIYGALILTF